MEADGSDRQSGRGSAPSASREILAFGAIGLALAAAIAWWSTWEEPARTVEVSPSAERPGGVGPASSYAGDASCAGCHPAIHQQCLGSGHSKTLRPAAEHPVASWLVGRSASDPARPESTWTYRLQNGRLIAERSEGDQHESDPLDFAFGSGNHAVTFLSMTETDPDRATAIEHRLSFFTQDNALGVTPGQTGELSRSPEFTPRGRALDPLLTRKCFDCHSTLTSAQGPDQLDVNTLIPNVSCERCHGPGKSHVEAARLGRRSDLAMRFGPGRWTAAELLKLCGQCHRTADMADPNSIYPDNPVLARFQPIGLMASACYRKSQGALSCVTCHDPHAKTLDDRPAYEAACLTCHKPDVAPKATPHATCPVSPQSGCIECHMPRVIATGKVPFTDHWIRVRSSTAPPAIQEPRK